jgi:hypothetical protein
MFGVVMLVFIYRKPIIAFYVRVVSISLALLWGVRVVLQIVWPQGSMTPALQFGMLSAFIAVFVLFAFSSFMIHEADR